MNKHVKADASSRGWTQEYHAAVGDRHRDNKQQSKFDVFLAGTLTDMCVYGQGTPSDSHRKYVDSCKQAQPRPSH